MKQLFADHVSAQGTASARGDNSRICSSFLVDLNVLAQKTFGSANPSFKHLQAVVRCDQMPLVPGPEDRFTQLFQNLGELVVDLPSSGSKLFLHVKVSSAEGAKDPSHMGIEQWHISVHTNRFAPSGWQSKHRQKLHECSVICMEQQGQFIFHSQNSGSLFILLLPGVLNTSNFG